MSVAGILFDVIQILIALGDVVSDLWVTVEFYQNPDQLLYAHMMTVSLALGSVGLATLTLIRYDVLNSSDYLLWFLVPLLAPVGLAMPVFAFFLTKFYDDGKGSGQSSANFNGVRDQLYDQDDDAGAAAGKAPNTPAASFSHKFKEKLDRESSSLHLLDEAMRERFLAYVVLLGQVGFESLPSAVIQLIATSVVGSPTTMQTVSLSLSLFSVVSKSFMASRSFSRAAVVFKLSAFAFDVFRFGLFVLTIFTTQLDELVPRSYDFILGGSSNSNNNGSSNTTNFSASSAGPLKVTALANVFVIVVIVKLSLVALVMFATIREIFRGTSGVCRKLGELVIGFAGLFFMGVPIFLVFQTMTLSWFVLLNHWHQPAKANFPAAAILLHFLFASKDNGQRPPEHLTDWRASTLRAKKWARETQHEQRFGNFNGRAMYDAKDVLPKIKQHFPLLLQSHKIDDDVDDDSSASSNNYGAEAASIQNTTDSVNNNSNSDTTPDEVSPLIVSPAPQERRQKTRRIAAQPDSLLNRCRHIVCAAQYNISMHHVRMSKMHYLHNLVFPVPDPDGVGRIADETLAALEHCWDPSLPEPDWREIFPRPVTFEFADNSLFSCLRPRIRQSSRWAEMSFVSRSAAYYSTKDGWASLFVVCCVLDGLICCLFQLLYFFIWLGTSLVTVNGSVPALWNQLLILQRLCLVMSLFWLLMSLVFLKDFVQYHIVSAFWRQRLQCGGTHDGHAYTYSWLGDDNITLSAQSMMMMIDSYRFMPLSVLAGGNKGVPPESIPETAMLMHVLPFLTPAQCLLFGFDDEQS